MEGLVNQYSCCFVTFSLFLNSLILSHLKGAHNDSSNILELKSYCMKNGSLFLERLKFYSISYSARKIFHHNKLTTKEGVATTKFYTIIIFLWQRKLVMNIALENLEFAGFDLMPKTQIGTRRLSFTLTSSWGPIITSVTC